MLEILPIIVDSLVSRRITQARGDDAGYSKGDGPITTNKEEDAALLNFNMGRWVGVLAIQSK